MFYNRSSVFLMYLKKQNGCDYMRCWIYTAIITNNIIRNYHTLILKMIGKSLHNKLFLKSQEVYGTRMKLIVNLNILELSYWFKTFLFLLFWCLDFLKIISIHFSLRNKRHAVRVIKLKKHM